MNAENKKLKKERIRKEKGAHRRKIRNFMVAILVVACGVMSFSFADTKATMDKQNVSEASMAGAFALSPLVLLKRAPDPEPGGGGADKLTDEQKALLAIFKGQVTDTIKAVLEKELPEADRTAFKNALKDIEKGVKKEDFDKLENAMKALGLEVGTLKEAPKTEKVASIKDQVKKALEERKADWEKFKKGEVNTFKIKLENVSVVNKVAGTITVGGNLGSSAYLPVIEMVPGVTPIARAQAFLEQYCNTSTTSSSRIVWVNKTNLDGNAAMTAEGGVKPLIDFEFETELSEAKKCTAKIKVSTEMLQDIDFIVGEIEGELRFQVDKVVDDQLLTGDGTGDNLTGLQTYAGGYVLTSINTNSPNRFDAIAAACAQIKSLNFMPTHVFLNPIDAVNMGLTKDKNDNYIFPAWKGTDGVTFPGLTVVESNKITVGNVLVGDMSKFNVRNYKSFSITWGWVNDDFEKNLVTVIGERRLHSYMSNNNTGAFVDDTFDNIQTAITPAP